MKAYLLRRLSCSAIVLLLLLCSIQLTAQSISGRVYDAQTNTPMRYVEVYNIYTQTQGTTDSLGRFSIKAGDGELIEFSFVGYKVARVRLVGNLRANTYNIGMTVGVIELDNLTVYDRSNRNQKLDSARTAEVFKRALELQRIEGFEAFKHPFSALDKYNRQQWAFQKRYHLTEKIKYQDAVFNARLIQQLTSLGKDSMEAYRYNFMPSYESLTGWNEYEYYVYIKQSVKEFRQNFAYYPVKPDPLAPKQ